MRQIIVVLGQHDPEGIDPTTVADDLVALEGVCDVHDLHLWTLTSGTHAATTHLVAGDFADGQTRRASGCANATESPT